MSSPSKSAPILNSTESNRGLSVGGNFKLDLNFLSKVKGRAPVSFRVHLNEVAGAYAVLDILKLYSIRYDLDVTKAGIIIAVKGFPLSFTV